MWLRRSLLFTVFLAPGALPALAADGDFAGTVDIGGGRKMYLECRGTGSPTVFIVPGGRAAADEWTNDSPVFADVAKFTRVCAYDRPGTPLANDSPSRSDPVPMPITVADSVADLHALVQAAKIETPFVIVGHSYGGLIVRLYAMTYPQDVDGMVLVDALSEFLRAAETPEEWVWQKKNSRIRHDGSPQDLSRYRTGGRGRQFRSNARGAAAPTDASGRVERRPPGGTACPRNDRRRPIYSRHAARRRLRHRPCPEGCSRESRCARARRRNT